MGSGQCDAEISRIAESVGRGIARHGAVLICGGGGGVMEAAARGGAEAGGLVVGILPDDSAEVIGAPTYIHTVAPSCPCTILQFQGRYSYHDA